MAMHWKIALSAALKAKRRWDRLPPEQKARILEATKTTVKTHGPVVAKKAADTARTQGPVVAQKAAETAQQAVEATRRHAPVLARRIAEAIEKARKP
jgi:acyl-CoA reductase-like NAD-dependent aldehyde dehydrogenase